MKLLTWQEVEVELINFIKKEASLKDLCKMLEVKYKPGIDCQEVAESMFGKGVLIDLYDEKRIKDNLCNSCMGEHSECVNDFDKMPKIKYGYNGIHNDAVLECSWYERLKKD